MQPPSSGHHQHHTHHPRRSSSCDEWVEAARIVSLECRHLLTSLRGGPVAVARGDLASNAYELRRQLGAATHKLLLDMKQQEEEEEEKEQQESKEEELELEQEGGAVAATTTRTASTRTKEDAPSPLRLLSSATLGVMDPSIPFLAVIRDPRAAGPHTLVALQALQRISPLLRTTFGVSHQSLVVGVLGCKFEQTDPAQDEAVEMAIADLLGELVATDHDHCRTTSPTTSTTLMDNGAVMDAVSTLFVTRGSFLHSPSLGYHLEHVLSRVITALFTVRSKDDDDDERQQHLRDRRAAVFGYLVAQLLQGPTGNGVGGSSGSGGTGNGNGGLTSSRGSGGGGGSGGGASLAAADEDALREAQLGADSARIVCLRLLRSAINCLTESTPASLSIAETDPTIVQLIQDDLCLALLMNGQAIWAYTASAAFTSSAVSSSTPGGATAPDPLSAASFGAGSPAFVSLELLSEITATVDCLWNQPRLRSHLVQSFQPLWTGLYTRALVLLRRRRVAQNPRHYHANLLFDEQVEIILESLVDLICLHRGGGGGGGGASATSDDNVDDGAGIGTMDSIFVYYDCNLNRSDVATDLFVELCRCCGGTVDEDGEAVLATLTPSSSSADLENLLAGVVVGDGGDDSLPGTTPLSGSAATTPPPSAGRSRAATAPALLVEHPLRPAPPHLKELCAQALMGAMKSLFRDDRPTQETLKQRATRKRSVMLRHVDTPILVDEDALSPSSASDEHATTESGDGSGGATGHYLRDIKSKKRLMRKAARIFNDKASRGIEFLLDAGLTPNPVTPASVAGFLRNGLVVGLDKKAVGAYLGEAGKTPVAGKSPPDWERDWFHKEVLKVYCSLFRFENQSLLDGLRMFLAAFRLPGEAQQIDRILQAFSDSCGQVCDESMSGRLKLFSEDPKRASDTAYLLSFSIIMLNTDRHNANIREDRKMSLDDFVKNNTDYGRDITEPGRAFPREYLQSIYDSINEEAIRTEGEGADGAMTVERWKDVLRGSTADTPSFDLVPHPGRHDAEDLTELILEHVWRPIVSALGALWGVNVDDAGPTVVGAHSQGRGADAAQPTGMLGAQGARLGMDLAVEMLHGVRKLGRIDIFRKIFAWVCDYSGLLGEYSTDAVSRTWTFTSSVEGQSAVVVALTTAVDAGEYLDEEGWRRVWLILFELRDLKLIPLRSAGAGNTILSESDPDLLTLSARSEWTICLAKGDMNFDTTLIQAKKPTSLLGAFGRALFGVEDSDPRSSHDGPSTSEAPRSAHGKEELVLWDDCGLSDDESDDTDAYDWPEEEGYELSPGAAFEALLIKENLDMNKRMDMPVTGLERVEDTRRYHDSPRARVRDRFRRAINFKAIVADSRFMDDGSVVCLLKSLVDVVGAAGRPTNGMSPAIPARRGIDRSSSGSSYSSGNFSGFVVNRPVISPASEAFAEILICELAIKNKDRLKLLWTSALQDHYVGRLTSLLVNRQEVGTATSAKVPGDPGLEKRVTGLFRLSLCALKREDVANDVLGTWKFVLPMNAEQSAASPLRILDRHFGEGLWRISCETDSLSVLNHQGWEGLVSLLTWGAHRGCAVAKPIRNRDAATGKAAFSDDDPALQTFRAAHLLVHTGDLALRAPLSILDSLRTLVQVGERRHYGQLGIASLDMMHLLLEKRLASLQNHVAVDKLSASEFWSTWWRRIVEEIAEAAELSSDTNVRQHALSVLTDLFLDKNGGSVPPSHLASVLSDVCVPLAGRRILKLQVGEGGRFQSSDELMIEFELCIGLIFKPWRHHLQTLLSHPSGESMYSVWKSILSALEELLCDDDTRRKKSLGGSSSSLLTAPSSSDDDRRPKPAVALPRGLRETMNNLANEHLRSAIEVLIASGILRGKDASSSPEGGAAGDDAQKLSDDMTSVTAESLGHMGIPPASIHGWK